MIQNNPRWVGRARSGLLLTLLLTSLPTGCAVSSMQEGSKLQPGTVDLIKVGMGKKEVLRLLGPPEEFRRPGIGGNLIGGTDGRSLGGHLQRCLLLPLHTRPSEDLHGDSVHLDGSRRQER